MRLKGYFNNSISLRMGNNHDKYFGSDKRKILILGVQGVGKTSLVTSVKEEKPRLDVQPTKNFNIEDIKLHNLQVSFFDLAGGERQRIFWKQQYEGTQGVIFVVDATKREQNRQIEDHEIDKLFKTLKPDIPFAICITKVDQVANQQVMMVHKQLAKKYEGKRKHITVFSIDYKNKESLKVMVKWLLTHTKPL